MSCERPLDPLDLEALASGEAPLLAGDAREHAASCPECGGRLEAFRGMGEWLAGVPAAVPVPRGFAESVQRLRAFSRRERWSPRLWAAPAALFFALLAASAFVLALPALSSAEQVRLWAALASAFGGEIRALALWPRLLLEALPPGMSALGEAARAERSFSAAAILLLLPAGFAVRKVFARRKIGR